MQIKERRRSRKLTQSDVAKEIGVSRSTVSMWESGETIPRTGTLLKLAALLSCTVDELLRDVTIHDHPATEE